MHALVLALSLLAAAKDFNGRWDIRIPEQEKKRAWWLEVNGSSGRFVGAPGGQMDAVPVIRVEGDELRFELKDGVYKAKLEKGQLVGTCTRDSKTLHWTGVRAPKLEGGDASKRHPADPVELFNGKDLTGWSVVVPGSQKAWYVTNGILQNEAGASDIRTDAKFWDFTLHVEYRLGPKSNSGIGLRARYEIQLYDDYGEPASLHGNGALYSRVAPVLNASKPAGQWQTLDITIVGNRLTVILNQAKVLDRVEIEGLTAMATEWNEAEPGPIQLQGDHGSVEFRKMTLTPLLKKKPKK